MGGLRGYRARPPLAADADPLTSTSCSTCFPRSRPRRGESPECGIMDRSRAIPRKPVLDPRALDPRPRFWGGADRCPRPITVFFVALRRDMGQDTAVTIGFLTFALARLWHVFNMRDAGTGLFSNEVARNRWVWYAIGICLALTGGRRMAARPEHGPRSCAAGSVRMDAGPGRQPRAPPRRAGCAEPAAPFPPEARPREARDRARARAFAAAFRRDVRKQDADMK